MRDFKELKYNASMQTALEMAKSWLDAKPDNPQLIELVKCLTDVYFYVNSLTLERKGFDSIVDDLNAKLLKFAEQEQRELEMHHDLEMQKRFDAELSDDINERLNNLL